MVDDRDKTIDPNTGGLLRTNLEVPLGGVPGRAWDTLLRPNTPYSIVAILHNSSSTPATNTVVRFWEFLGGVGSNGKLLDVKLSPPVPMTDSATVPPPIPLTDPVRVAADQPFISGNLTEPHKCAVISISDLAAGTCPEAVTSDQVPDPQVNSEHSCSAWRNTDSTAVVAGGAWKTILAAVWPQIVKPVPGPDPGPIDIEIEGRYVPREWQNSREIASLKHALRELGGGISKPVYLLNETRSKFKAVDLKIKVSPGKQIVSINADKKPKSDTTAFSLNAKAGRAADFVVSGTVPKTANEGDVFLVTVTARYPQWGNLHMRAIQFLQVLHVTKNKG